MNAALFQLYKVKRLIVVQGQNLLFSRQGENEFGEPNGQTESVTIKGVYHETTSFLSKTSTEATTIQQKSSPMVLCLWKDTENISDRYRLSFNNKTYTIGGIKNLAEANLIAEISLEEVQADVK